MRSKGFILTEALVGFTITIISCTVLVMSFQNMNQFSMKQRDKINAHLSFIKMIQTNKKSLIINGYTYKLKKEYKTYYIENKGLNNVYKIEKN